MASIFDNTSVAPPVPVTLDQFAVDLANSNGLNISIIGGNVMIAGILAVVAETALVLTANAINFICINFVSGTIINSVGVVPVGDVAIYQLTTNANAIVGAVDMRSPVYPGADVGILPLNNVFTGNNTFNLPIVTPNTAEGYASVATAAGVTTLVVSSPKRHYFTGIAIQQVVMPVVSTLQLGQSWKFRNFSTGAVTIQSSGGNTIIVLNTSEQVELICIAITGTTAASWDIIHAVQAGQLGIAQDFRLTLTSGTPVTSGDVTTATTIYCTPYKGNNIGLWNGSTWINYSSNEFSLALGTLTAHLVYDVFCYENAGVPALEFLAWASTTARATALSYNAGFLVKSTDATRRYLGSFYTISAIQTCDMGQIASTASGRYLYNYYNRVVRNISRLENTGTWSYSSNIWRLANGSTNNQLNFLIGVVEDEVNASVHHSGYSNVTGRSLAAAIGLNSTSAPVTNGTIGHFDVATIYSGQDMLAFYNGMPALGLNHLAWLEYIAGGSTGTFYGSGAAYIRTGITGKVTI